MSYGAVKAPARRRDVVHNISTNESLNAYVFWTIVGEKRLLYTLNPLDKFSTVVVIDHFRGVTIVVILYELKTLRFVDDGVWMAKYMR
jgi:hypothetical protein